MLIDASVMLIAASVMLIAALIVSIAALIVSIDVHKLPVAALIVGIVIYIAKLKPSFEDKATGFEQFHCYFKQYAAVLAEITA